MPPDDRNLAARVYQAAYITGEFTLRSGRNSDWYFDKYRFESDPSLLQAIAARMALQIPPGTELLAGLELGGVPLATALSLQSGLPCLFVRKAAKEYGTCKLAEGPYRKGQHVAVVEDVITSGGQAVASANQLCELGLQITAILCVVDREQGGAENIAKAGYAFAPAFTLSQLSGA